MPGEREERVRRAAWELSSRASPINVPDDIPEAIAPGSERRSAAPASAERLVLDRRIADEVSAVTLDVDAIDTAVGVGRLSCTDSVVPILLIARVDDRILHIRSEFSWLTVAAEVVLQRLERIVDDRVSRFPLGRWPSAQLFDLSGVFMGLPQLCPRVSYRNIACRSGRSLGPAPCLVVFAPLSLVSAAPLPPATARKKRNNAVAKRAKYAA